MDGNASVNVGHVKIIQIASITIETIIIIEFPSPSFK